MKTVLEKIEDARKNNAIGLDLYSNQLSKCVKFKKDKINGVLTRDDVGHTYQAKKLTSYL